MRRKRVGVCLVVGACLTFLWVMVCPSYEVHGPTSYTYEQNLGGGTSVRMNRKFAVPGDLWGGVLILWALVGAGYCLVPEARDVEASVRSSNDKEKVF